MATNDWMLALDLGGTDLKSGRVRADGSLAAFERRPSRTADGPEAPFEAMLEALESAKKDGSTPVGVGLGCPGGIDPIKGRQLGRTAHLPHWEDVPLRQELSRRLGLKAVVDNDANLAALAEHRLGAARSTRASITVTLGTGIGCGIVVEGRVLRGAHGGAGELGHVPLAKEGEPCACGVPDCVEPEASAPGLLRRARAAGLETKDAAAVFALAATGHETARRLVNQTMDRLGATVASAIHLLDPEVLVVGGGVSQAGEALLAPLRDAVRRYTLPSHFSRLRIVPAALGERAGTVGAGLLAWESLSRSG